MHMPQDDLNINLAQSALQYFNNKHDSDYELVKVLYTISSICNDGLWYHCNFQAKSQASALEDDLKLFFAEKKDGDSGITTCCILDGERVTGCGMCYGPIIHPPSGFQKGDLSKVKYRPCSDKGGDAASEQESSSQHTINAYLGYSPADAHLFSTPHYYPEPQEEPSCSQGSPTKEVAEAALKYYNKNTMFLIPLLKACVVVTRIFTDADGVWAHCNFRAKSEADTSTKLFFAEQNRDYRERATYGITACCILDGKKTTTGCVVCQKVIHPTGRFRKGRYKSQYRVLRLRLPPPPRYTITASGSPT